VTVWGPSYACSKIQNAILQQPDTQWLTTDLLHRPLLLLLLSAEIVVVSLTNKEVMQLANTTSSGEHTSCERPPPMVRQMFSAVAK